MEHSSMRAGGGAPHGSDRTGLARGPIRATTPEPGQPNPEPDKPATPELPEEPANDADAWGRPIPALLRRWR